MIGERVGGKPGNGNKRNCHYRRGDQLREHEQPQQVRKERSFAGGVNRSCHDREGKGDEEIADAELQQEVSHAFPPASVRPSKTCRSLSISAREIFFCSIRWVISGASEPPVSLSARDSS